MRVAVPVLFVFLLLLTGLASLPTASAGYGQYGPDGWPVSADGTSTNPYRGTMLDAPWVRPEGEPPADRIAFERDAYDARFAHDAQPGHDRHHGHSGHAHRGADPLDLLLPRIGTLLPHPEPLGPPADLDEEPVTLYPYYPLLTKFVQDLADRHPDKVRLVSIGKSTLGLDLWMLEIADFDRIEAGEGIPLDQREVVWVDGGTHSNEYSGVYFVTSLATYLLDEYESDERARWIVENRHTWLLPMVNPDGSHAFGRLNAQAVNINRNYPVDWGETEESFPLNNPGPHPESEVETRLNIEWFNRTDPDYYASVHCCGNLWLYPYGVEGWDPLDDAMLDRVCEEAFPAVRDDCGPIWSTIYPASGSSVDTAYEYTGAVAFGYEMSGRGAALVWGQPFTTESVRVQERESWQGVMHAFENVHLYGAFPEWTGLSVSGDRVQLAIENRGYGSLAAGNVTTTLADGRTIEISLPSLAPGEGASVDLGVAVPVGLHEVEVSYQKRLQAAPEGRYSLTMEVVEDASQRTVTIAGHAVTRGELSIIEAGSAPTPVVLPLLLLALLGIGRLLWGGRGGAIART